MLKENIGYKFYSHYLGTNCRVTKYWTDKHWWFKAEGIPHEMKAGTRLSYFKGQEDEKRRQRDSDIERKIRELDKTKNEKMFERQYTSNWIIKGDD